MAAREGTSSTGWQVGCRSAAARRAGSDDDLAADVDESGFVLVAALDEYNQYGFCRMGWISG